MQQEIRCPNCGLANVQGQKFCGGCGCPLSAPSDNICPNCGTTLRPGDKFCGNCGAQLPTQAGRPSGSSVNSTQSTRYSQGQHNIAQKPFIPPQSVPSAQATWGEPVTAERSPWEGSPVRQSSRSLLILLVVLIIGLGAFGWWAFFGNPPWSGGAGLLVTRGPFIEVTGEQTGSTRDVTIIWESNKQTVGMVEYGADENYGKASAWESTYVTAHSIKLSALELDTRYHYRVIIRDKDGTEFRTGNYTFKTPQ